MGDTEISPLVEGDAKNERKKKIFLISGLIFLILLACTAFGFLVVYLINIEINGKDPCAGLTCLNDDECIVENGEPVCNCSSNFEGKTCEIRKDPCSDVKCLNEGKCAVENDEAVCKCSEDFEGKTCEIRKDPCADVKCLNEGTCAVENDEAVCKCSEDFEGETCEISKKDLSDCLKIDTNLQGRKGSKVIDYVATAGLCSKYCKNDDNCNNWIWHNSMTGIHSYKCALVKSYVNEIKEPNIMTGSKLCQVLAEESESCVIKDTNLQGRIGTEKIKGVKSWGECAALCKERTSCKAWVWHNESTGRYAENCVTLEGFGRVVPNRDGVMFGFQSCQDEN